LEIMTRVLVTTHAITGHVRYAVPLVRELAANGHEVLWYTGQMFESLVVGAGAKFAPMTERTGFDFSTRDALQGAPGRAGGMSGFRDTLMQVFIRPIPAFVADLTELFASFEPDVLVTDHSFMAGMLLAEQRGLPRVAFSTGVLNVPSVDTAPHGTGLPPARGPLGRLRNRALYRLVYLFVLREAQAAAAGIRSDLGLPALPGFFISWPPRVADRYIQSSIPEMEYPRRDLASSVVFVGPLSLDGMDQWTPPAWWSRIAEARAAGRPIVFVTQGTAATDPQNLLLPTVEALADRDVLVIGTTGGLDPSQVLPDDRRPANTVLEPYIPFTEVLGKVDLLVTNGGFGGVQTALSHGVPLVAVGDSEDHMENNARVKWSGAGIALREERQTAAAMAKAVDQVLSEPRFRERARELMTAYQRYSDGPRRAAQVILDVAASGTREDV
jgi:UDP:flavonoid glycosyltransferase YjiC (YdhE family)